MECKRRSSLDDPGVASTALRRLTQTPRLGLRRPGSTLSSSSSIASHEHDDSSTACVSRNASHDDCALHRFMVWAAVKRNACDKMTSEERRECPLLRCRKRFPNHELMLQHLYTCEELAAGEYWCYDCTRVERFNDTKCKRCLGHPSRRRRIMFMAKNFFSSLGHRSKTGSLPDLDLDVDEEAPPSYVESLDDIPAPPSQPEQAELQAIEIHEIDSNEVPLPTIMEDAEEEPVSDRQQIPEPVAALAPAFFRSPPTVRPVELESANWQPPCQSATVAPIDLNVVNDDQERNTEPPSLQVQTTDLAQYRAQVRHRSEMLGRARSTASTASTNSTSSTASYAISRMSSRSGGLTRVSGFDSALTSPADDFAPSNPFSSTSKPAVDKAAPTNPFTLSMPADEFALTNPFRSTEQYPGDQLSGNVEQPLSSELPADIPMVDVMPPSDAMGASLDPFQTPFAFVDPRPTQALPLESSRSMDDSAQAQPQISELESETTEPHRVSAHSLVGTTWGALQMHIAESMERLGNIKDNHLVDQLRTMSPEAVASSGLQTLLSILDRAIVDSPVDLLCFVHLVYSFSIVIHEQDAPSRDTELFSQAVSYASWLTRPDRHAYLPIVDVLWKPNGMSESEVVGLIRKTSTSAASRPKGKLPQQSASDPANDSLAFVAQFFLDELEHSAVQETNRADVQASELCVQHMKDTTFDLNRGTQVDMTVDFLESLLSQKYSEAPNFVTRLKQLRNRVNSNYGSTARRLELELMHLGKTYLSPDSFFDSYIPLVRAHIDSLYSLATPDFGSRLAYHRLGVQLIELIIHGSAKPSTSTNSITQSTPEIDIDELMGSMTPNLANLDFSALSALDPTLEGFTDPLPNSALDSSSVTPNTMESGHGSSTAATSPPSPEQAPPTGAKIESDSCCEICGYRPEGDPRWFPGSMAKHKKLQHATSPPKIYQCPYPGCASKYRNRPDNLRQHQLKKGHFVDGEDASQNRPCKRKKME